MLIFDDVFISKVSASLAASAIKAGGKALREKFGTPARQRAVEHCAAAGLKALGEEGISGEPEDRRHVESVLGEFFAEPATHVAVANLLKATEGNAQKLAELFEADYVSEQLPLDVERGFTAFALAFLDRAAEEGELQDVVQTRNLVEQTTLLRQILEELRKPGEAPPPLPSKGADRLLGAYLRSLAEECSRLPLGVIDTRFTSAAGEKQIPLPDIYVDLDVVTPVAEREAERSPERWALRAARGEGEERTPVLEAVLRPEHRRAVLVGEAGSGKTTFVHYLTYLLAIGDAAVPEALKGQVPVRLVLRDVAARHIPAVAEVGRAGMLWSALAADMEERLGKGKSSGAFERLRERLIEEGGLVLLDGLDEVPEADERRKTLRQAVEDLAGSLGESSRVLVTARPYAYADPESRLKDFTTLALAPFSDEQAERFVERWYSAVRGSLQWSPEVAKDQAGALLEALRDRPYLADLASRPLLLTLMATLHSSWGRLPDDRADLYEEIVHLLLGRWQRARKTKGPDGEEIVEPAITETLRVGEERIRARLEELAYRVHERQRSDPERREESADISEGEVLEIFGPLLEEVSPGKLLRYLRHRAGLLVERRSKVYAFPHRSFQEYLAASCLADRPEADIELRNRVAEDPRWWREVFLLAVGKARKGGLSRAVSAVRTLLAPGPGEDPALEARKAALAGEALVELRLLERAREELPTYEGLILAEVRKRLVEVMKGSVLAAVERAGAGCSLAKLRDPRREVLEVDAMELCWVPAGRFVMGSEEEERKVIGKEKPEHEYDLPYGYWLARYPVTQGQYREFVDAGGYRHEGYWVEAEAAGWWREGKVKHWDGGDFEGEAHRYGERFDGANQAVVGVSWWEGLAFCRWLEERWRSRGWLDEGWGVSLPNEPEWEKAARGGEQVPLSVLRRRIGGSLGVGDDDVRLQTNSKPRRRYPWGDDPDGERMNFHSTGIGSTSAVGCFPEGASPYGCDELSGNVWEWTRSCFDDYPYPADLKERRKREDLSSEATRVLRGGAFYNGSSFVRCSVRAGNFPAAASTTSVFELWSVPILL